MPVGGTQSDVTYPALGDGQVLGKRAYAIRPRFTVAYGGVMFVDMVLGPMSDWELVAEHSKLVSEPPEGLLACIVVPEGVDQVRGITVWETPGQRGDSAASVMMPLFESGLLAGVQSSPEPVQPVALFLRGQDAQ